MSTIITFSTSPSAAARWTPRFRYGRRPELDLGESHRPGRQGNLAVPSDSEELQEHSDFLLDAGGDCYCEGSRPEDDGWRVGVETLGGDLPLAVLAVNNKGCATSRSSPGTGDQARAKPII